MKNLLTIKSFLPFYLVVSSFIIQWPVFYNGYPLFYSDSALYILASNLFGTLQYTEDMPFLSGIGYSWFIRVVTWRSTLYLVVFAQALVLNILIYMTLKELLRERKLIVIHLSIITVLSMFSSMGWTASQLMPDIFTSYIILSLFLFYSETKKHFAVYIFLSIVIITALLSHLSNIGITILLIFSIPLALLFIKAYKENLKLVIGKSLIILALIVSSMLILVGLNIKYYNYSGLSPTGNIFFMARLMDTGFMKEFLEEKCPEKNYVMCRYVNDLPDSYEGFLWDTDKVFYKTGGWNIHAHHEYGKIAADILTTPKYLGKFLLNCIQHSYRQILSFETGEGFNSIYTKESTPYQVVIRHFDKKEFSENFLNARQNHGKLKFDFVNKVNYLLLGISAFIILLSFVLGRFNDKILLITIITFLGLITNAIATSSLSSVFHRFQSRVIWLVPFLACIYLYGLLVPLLRTQLKRISEKDTNKST